jgi:antitoxin component HigA of HigAB toxin-antitoxin module
MPRTLHDVIELDAVTEIIDLMAGHPLSADQADYLETLAELAAAYESVNHEALPALPPHEFLAAHLENIGMTATEWGKLIGIDRSTASRLLRGERKFNTAHVRKTAEALNLEASLLI